MKKIVSSILLSTIALGLGATAVFAEGVTKTEENQYTTDATVNLLEGEAQPTAPETKNDPDGTTNQNGPLSIDQVIRFNFEDMRLSGKKQSAKLKTKTDQNIQVTDLRGTGAGWNLRIKQSPLVDGEKVLKGAVIKLSSPEINGVGDFDRGLLPDATEYNVTADNKDKAATIMKAEKDKGMGTWVQNYKADNITLDIPAGNLVGNYAGTVTWELSDNPTPPEA